MAGRNACRACTDHPTTHGNGKDTNSRDGVPFMLLVEPRSTFSCWLVVCPTHFESRGVGRVDKKQHTAVVIERRETNVCVRILEERGRSAVFWA